VTFLIFFFTGTYEKHDDELGYNTRVGQAAVLWQGRIAASLLSNQSGKHLEREYRGRRSSNMPIRREQNLRSFLGRTVDVDG
jgi:hypothetical protein